MPGLTVFGCISTLSLVLIIFAAIYLEIAERHQTINVNPGGRLCLCTLHAVSQPKSIGY